MLRKYIIYGIIAILIMIGLQFLMVKLCSDQAAMGCMILLFFCVNPITSIIYGIISEIYKLKFFPLLLSILFVIGFWVCLDWLNMDALVYGGIYLVIGYASAGITFLIKKYRK